MVSNGAVASIDRSPNCVHWSVDPACTTRTRHVLWPARRWSARRRNQARAVQPITCSATRLPWIWPLFKVFAVPRHLVGRMCEADDIALLHFGQRIQSRGFHFHCQNAARAAGLDHRFRLPKGCIGCPSGAHVQRNAAIIVSGVRQCC